MEGDCVLTSAWSRTPTIVDAARLMRFSAVLIDGGSGWLGHKPTYAINDHFQNEHAQWGAPINALMIVVSLSDSFCSCEVRCKGVSERSEFAPCHYTNLTFVRL